jgi:hypothetical protein
VVRVPAVNSTVEASLHRAPVAWRLLLGLAAVKLVFHVVATSWR